MVISSKTENVIFWRVNQFLQNFSSDLFYYENLSGCLRVMDVSIKGMFELMEVYRTLTHHRSACNTRT